MNLSALTAREVLSMFQEPEPAPLTQAEIEDKQRVERLANGN
jgi:hypothetical protein